MPIMDAADTGKKIGRRRIERNRPRKHMLATRHGQAIRPGR